MFYDWRATASQTPLKRAKTVPKLERMGIQNILLVGLTSAGLMEILCLFTKMLYDCQMQRQEIPFYVPQCYRNMALTADLEKMGHISPALLHARLLRCRQARDLQEFL